MSLRKREEIQTLLYEEGRKVIIQALLYEKKEGK